MYLLIYNTNRTKSTQ